MKRLLLLLVLTFTLSCCNKDDDPQPVSELDKLPPATQVGADKIGCLLDGKAFLPGNHPNSTNCFYQFVNGGYYFHVSIDNEVNSNLIGLAVNTNRREISEGEVIPLIDENIGNASGNYYRYFNTTFTNQINTGELKITKLDPVNFIVSGTFWYNILDYQGIKHEIREGRFDMHYTN
jgi:hypothetical protein